jgi:hypothetical protein
MHACEHHKTPKYHVHFGCHKRDITDFMSVLMGKGGWEEAKVAGRILVWVGARDSRSLCKLDGS